MYFITVLDYVLLPLYLAFFYWRVKKMSLKYKEPEIQKILFTGFGFRMLGAVAFSMVMQYYYGFGDSFIYYFGGKFFSEQINADFSNIYYLFAPFDVTEDFYINSGSESVSPGYFVNPANNMVMRISAVLSYLSFDKFLIISLFFGFFSFLGQWKLFMVFDDLNKQRNRKLLAFAVLYSPSIWFWGSGLLKDSICLGSLGFIIHILYKLFVKRKFSFRDLFLLIFLVFIVSIIKSYISTIILAGLLVIAFSFFLKSIKNRFARATTLFLAIVITGTMLYLSDFTNEINDMAEESIQQIKEFQQNYQMSQETDESSKAAYNIGELDATLGSIVLKSPAVIFNCLFRPFIWESRKIIILFTSFESMAVFLATLYIMFKMGLITFFKRVFGTPHLLFCFVISMLFALIIGFTTFNFGTMIRYKVIFLPFYYFMLVNLYTMYVAPKKQLKVNGNNGT